MTRKKYSKEFKLDAVALVLEQGYSTADAARSLDLRYNILNRWVNEHKQNDEQAFRGKPSFTEALVRTFSVKNHAMTAQRINRFR